MSSIFVSIAAYRDPEVAHTLESLINNASRQHTLAVTLLSQCPPHECQEFPNDPARPWARINHEFVAADDSEGACWARARIQRHYAGECYYLQIDSHVQMTPDWDSKLIHQHAQVTHSGTSAVLTAYLPAYEIIDGAHIVRHRVPTTFAVEQRQSIPGARPRMTIVSERPARSWFFSGHFAFTTGDFVTKVPYDPELFFFGEEISLAIRAFTSGYDFYTPCDYVGAHLYRRVGPAGTPRPLYWNETDDARRSVRWYDRDRMSKIKVAAICRGEWFGQYGIRNKSRFEAFRQALLDEFQVDPGRARADFPSADATRAADRGHSPEPC
jgi:hypothetical protein